MWLGFQYAARAIYIKADQIFERNISTSDAFPFDGLFARESDFAFGKYIMVA